LAFGIAVMGYLPSTIITHMLNTDPTTAYRPTENLFAGPAQPKHFMVNLLATYGANTFWFHVTIPRCPFGQHALFWQHTTCPPLDPQAVAV